MRNSSSWESNTLFCLCGYASKILIYTRTRTSIRKKEICFEIPFHPRQNCYHQDNINSGGKGEERSHAQGCWGCKPVQLSWKSVVEGLPTTTLGVWQLVLRISLSPVRITWKGSLNEGQSRSGLHWTCPWCCPRGRLAHCGYFLHHTLACRCNPLLSTSDCGCRMNSFFKFLLLRLPCHHGL